MGMMGIQTNCLNSYLLKKLVLSFNFPESYIWVAKAKEQRSIKEHLALNLQRAVNWVEVPDLLILDEPLAGLGRGHTPDWKARADVVKLLKHLKKELTILVVSHDLKELAALVDHSWRMEMGGFLREELLPL
ncbi:hypothetical protein H0E87_031640 [Populus deltoides]|uniref:Uncharacterized protein n=1 Tax=Populus deltoides TaxID=3696 RepID=A0A8T2WDT8_POPDE|nr:hypothetical protein H0E87_031640 [Populus deltoides]